MPNWQVGGASAGPCRSTGKFQHVKQPGRLMVPVVASVGSAVTEEQATSLSEGNILNDMLRP